MRYLAEHSYARRSRRIDTTEGIRIQQSSLFLWWAPQSNRVHTLITQKKDTSILLISETKHMHSVQSSHSELHALRTH